MILRNSKYFRTALTISLLINLSACKVVSLEEDQLARQQQSGNFDAQKYVDSIWSTNVVPYIEDNAIDAVELKTAFKHQTIDQVGSQFGRQAGEGSPWTFITQAEGVVIDIDQSTRQGTADIKLTDDSIVQLLIGPVVFSTSVRDALDFVSFNDFANQISFADVGNAMTNKAMVNNQTNLHMLSEGQKIHLLGTFAIYSPEDPVQITPIAVQVIQR